MKKSLIIAGLSCLALFACTTVPESDATEENSVENAEGDTPETAADHEAEQSREPLSFDPQSKFAITVTEEPGDDNTGISRHHIYLKHDLLKKPLLITTDNSYIKITDPDSYGMPKDIVFAFNTWYAGGGYTYYGIVRNGVLQIFRNYEDEGAPVSNSYELYREIDPEVVTPLPAYYISYRDDAKKARDLMIAFDQNGKALYAKYFGQGRHIALKFEKDASSGRNLVLNYSETVNGKVHGTYVLTHSGNWDYAEYTHAQSGKKTRFTIDHDVTIMGGTYRTVPSL